MNFVSMAANESISGHTTVNTIKIEFLIVRLLKILC